MAFPTDIDGLRAAGYKYLDDGTCRTCRESIEWWETTHGKKIAMNFGTAVPHFKTCSDSESFRRPTVGRSDYEANNE